jgi:hypothetical protein
MGSEFAQMIEWNYAQSLDWFLLRYPMHDAFKRMVSDLNLYYKNTPALWQDDFTQKGFQWIEPGDYSQSVLSYINRKLTIKEAPAPEKTIKAFPLRTALSAACSALLICTLMFSFGALNGLMPASEGGYIAQSEEMPEEIEEEIVAMNQ